MALVVAGVLVGLLGGTAPALADPWSASSSRSATVSVATTGSRLQLLSGSGAVTADGAQYSLATVAGSMTGFVELVNTSSVPATVSLTTSMGSLVASTPATVCSQSWVLPAGTCPGTSTVVALTPVLGSQTGTWSSPGLLDPGSAAHLRVQTSGVVGTVTLTTNPVVPRPGGQDRTTA